MGKCGLQDREEVLKKFRVLIRLNKEVAQIYKEASCFTRDADLKKFFADRSKQRTHFVRGIENELLKRHIRLVDYYDPKTSVCKQRNHFKRYHNLDNENLFFNIVYRIKRYSLSKYDEALREAKLPLTVCRILIRQRDNVNYAVNVLKRQEETKRIRQ